MTAKDTLGLNKTEFTEKLTKIINNHRANAMLCGEPLKFVLKACRLSDSWSKVAFDPDCKVFLRNLDIANGRKVKMLSLERKGRSIPVSKSKLIQSLYPTRKTASSATAEEKHFNAVKGAMRLAIEYQLKEYRASQEYPIICQISGKRLVKGARVDVDHCGMPFAEIADRFVAAHGPTYADMVLAGPKNAKKLADPVIAELWLDFHAQHCRLAVVCASANRQKGAAGYATPQELLGSLKAKAPDEISLDF